MPATKGTKMWLIYGNGIFSVTNKSNVCHFQAVDDIGDYHSKFQRDKISLFLPFVGSRFYKYIKSYTLQKVDEKPGEQRGLREVEEYKIAGNE